MERLPGPAPARRPIRLPRLRSRRWAGAGVVLAGLALAGCQVPSFGAYRGATKQGQDAFKLWQGFFITGAAVFALVFILIVWSVLRYRRRSDEIPKQTQYHTAFEVFYTVVPIIMVLALFAFTFVTENDEGTVAAKAMVVNVTAFQWGWQFQYPGYDVRVLGVERQDPTMVVPVGENIHVYLRSKDVIHGFYVPAFNFSRYAMPGITTQQFDFTVLHPTTYRGQCTQFCGLYHSYMIFQVKAVTPAQFQAWITQKQNSPTTEDTITAAKAQIKGALR